MKKNKGFTLAELLVVVAIIAVLVAISIPVFTSQIEKAREATDLANIRAAYAELMSAVITGDTDVDETVTKESYHPLKSNSNIYYTTSGSVSTYIMHVNMSQTQPGWSTSNALDSLKELFTYYNENTNIDETFNSVKKGSIANIAYTGNKCVFYFTDKNN